MSGESVLLVAPWAVLIIYCGIVWLFSPRGVSARQFFKGSSDAGASPALWVLVFSAATSWIFAKSIANAANLGQAFGITGGIGYATYYSELRRGGGCDLFHPRQRRLRVAREFSDRQIWRGLCPPVSDRHRHPSVQ